MTWSLLHFARRDEHAAELGTPHDLDRHELTDAFFGQQTMKIVHAADWLAGEFANHITGT